MALNTPKPVYKLKSKRTFGGAPPVNNTPPSSNIGNPADNALKSGFVEDPSSPVLGGPAGGSKKTKEQADLTVTTAVAGFTWKDIFLYGGIALLIILVLIFIFKKK